LFRRRQFIFKFQQWFCHAYQAGLIEALQSLAMVVYESSLELSSSPPFCSLPRSSNFYP
jgi:hypothetical protein